MTEYKRHIIGKKHKSLYLGLAYNIVIGVLIALTIFFAITIPATYIIEKHYATADKKKARAGDYAADLQDFVTSRQIDSGRVDEINDWIRGEPYVFLLVYDTDNRVVPSAYNSATAVPGIKNKIQEISGSRIDDSLDRNTLIEMAQENGFYEINLADSIVVVAICEFTEDFYIGASRVTAIFLALVAFIAALVNYIRITIERIKRFESDVTIVSEIDMKYEIVSEGADEIAKLSGNVEIMRQRMLENIKNEQEAREANTELIAAISHDIRTPLTVLLGYLEMMKERPADDPVMQGYIASAESTAYRLKQLSDNMFKYSLAFGDTEKSVSLEQYDAETLFDQLFFEHIVLLRENGYEVEMINEGESTLEGCKIVTDAPNLMRIFDNVFSNLEKYADKDYVIVFTRKISDGKLYLECKNRITKQSKEVESNGIGLKNCVRLGSMIADKFEYDTDGETFSCRLVISLVMPDDENNEDTE